MAKIGSLSTITTGYGSAEQLNNNFSEIRNAILNTLSLDGSTPNGMGVDLDLNGQSLINAYSIQANTITIGGNALALSTLQTLESISDDIVSVANINGDVQIVSSISGDVSTVVANITEVQNVGSNITAITTVNSNILDVSTVATYMGNVNLIASNITDVQTLATNINDVKVLENNIADIQTLADIEDGTVASNALSNLGPISTDITAVAGSLSNVTTVSGSISNVNTVAASISNVNITGGSIASVNTVASNITNVNTVAGVDTEVTTVAGISTDVSTVSGISSNVTTVAANIASVNTVATNIASVISVANDLTEAVSEVETVANDLNEAVSEIDTVATNIADVNTVGLNISDVTTVSSNISDVNTVAGVSTNVTTVAGISANVTTVAGIASDVTTVASDSAVINTVATAITDVSTVSADIASVITAANDLNEAVSEIETVAASITNVDLVGTDITNVNTVATNISNVNTTAASITNVNTVSGSIANVNTVATNILDVTTVAGISSDVTTVAADGTDIGTVATDIANVNTVAGDISNVNTVATNISSVNDFFNVYRIGSTDPTTSLDTGDLFYNTTTGTLKVYTGTAWEQGVTAGSGFLPLTGGTLTGTLNGTAASFSGTVSASSYTGDGSGLSGINTDLVSDTTPQLGGNLDTNGYLIAGRNIATDGSKLDGIETGATADQTKADIDALGINAATLDSLDSTQFLRSDASDSMSGDLSISQATAGTATLEVRNTGGSGNNALVAKFWGDSDGLEIRNYSAGDYRIVNPQQDNGISIMDGTGGVKLRYNGVDVAGCDSSGGFEVTGAITASGAISSGGNTVLTTADYDVQVCHLKTNVDASVTQGSANEFTVNFNLEEHNDTSTFSHSSGVVTVATAGWYRIVANLVYQNAASSLRNTIRAYVKKNGTEVTSTATYDYDRGTSYGEFSNNKINTMLYLAANDTIEIANYGKNIDGTVTIESAECEFMVSSETVQASSTNADTVDGYHASQLLPLAGTGINVSGQTVSLDGTGTVGAGTYGSTANGTKIDNITVDAYGRVTAVTTGATGDLTGDGAYFEDQVEIYSDDLGADIDLKWFTGGTGSYGGGLSFLDNEVEEAYVRYTPQQGATPRKLESHCDGNLSISTLASNSQIDIEANGSGSDVNISANDDIIISFGNGSETLTFDAGASEVRLSCRMEATEFEATSDINLKENIELLTDPLGKLSGISGYSYNFKDTGKASYGVIAQEVEEVLPDAVATNAEGTKSVNYNSIVALLVETVKEQEKRIIALEKKVGL